MDHAPRRNAVHLSQREYFWDSLRALLMLLGIPYHVALSYRVGQQWIVRSNEGVPGFALLADGLHLFRMPAFFVVAGYFAAKVIARRPPGVWMAGRARRLVPPFVTAIVLLVPPMNWFCEISNLPHAAAVQSWKANSSSSGGYWVRHLWFIVVLLYCSGALALMASLRPGIATARLPARIDAALSRHFVPALLAVGAIVGLWEALVLEGFYMAGLATNVPQAIFRIDDLIVSAPWFVLGCLLERSPAMLARVTRFSWPMLAIAVASVVLSLTVAPELHPAAGRFVTTFAALSVSQVLIASAKAWLDRPSPLVREMVAASFVIYLFHLPLICGLVWLGQGVPVPTPVKALAVMAFSFGLSWLAWRVIVRSDVLLTLFDGSSRAEERRRRLSAMTADERAMFEAQVAA